MARCCPIPDNASRTCRWGRQGDGEVTVCGAHRQFVAAASAYLEAATIDTVHVFASIVLDAIANDAF